jgi:hypothetical protein
MLGYSGGVVPPPTQPPITEKIAFGLDFVQGKPKIYATMLLSKEQE